MRLMVVHLQLALHVRAVKGLGDQLPQRVVGVWDNLGGYEALIHAVHHLQMAGAKHVEINGMKPQQTDAGCMGTKQVMVANKCVLSDLLWTPSFKTQADRHKSPPEQALVVDGEPRQPLGFRVMRCASVRGAPACT